MTKAIRIESHGGPEVLSWVDVQVGTPGPGQVRLRHTAIGLNFIDTYHRTGLYPVSLPSGLGIEAAGVVEAVGEGVDDVGPGDRVAYAAGPPDGYAEARLMAADRLVRLPEDIDDRTAAAVMLKGMTAEYLVRRTYPVNSGDRVLIHAAAGGVGLLLCQWASHLGATVIGTVGTDEKAEKAAAFGCHHPIVYDREDFAERVRELTDGAGVQVVYDGVGQATFDKSLECLVPLGMMVSFGQASGPVPPFDVRRLSTLGSLFLTRPTLMTYNAKREDLLLSARALFEVLGSGAVRVEIGQTYPLEAAAQAHRDLEARKTTGSTVLLP
jgi:NADPH2:quinone reductase